MRKILELLKELKENINIVITLMIIITICLITALTACNWLWGNANESKSKELFDLLKILTAALLSMASTVIGYYFGSRPEIVKLKKENVELTENIKEINEQDNKKSVEIDIEESNLKNSASSEVIIEERPKK